MSNRYASRLIESLISQGVIDFCIAPGSRSTPLTLSVADNPLAISHIHFDERGLGFFALGMAKVIQKPVAIIVTSGTAVANLLPAVIEAHYSHIPLIILSADRPIELLDTGANQAIDQTHIFGRYVNWFFQLSPDEAITDSVILSTANQAILACMGIPKGPVHLNLEFREPLFTYETPLEPRANSKLIYPILTIQESDFNLILTYMQDQKGVLIVGELQTKQERIAVSALADHLKWPVLSDITASISSHFVIDYVEEFIDLDTSPTLLIYIGGRINSAALLDWISKQQAPYIQIKSHSLREDPLHQVTLRVPCDITWACHKLIEKFSPSEIWEDLEINRPIHPDLHRLSEIYLADFFKQNLSSEILLFCSNSLPIRKLNAFGKRALNPFKVLANRGASGIDGIIATAIGAAQASQKRTLLWIGDLAALYDLNSLALLKSLKHPFIIVITNNDGGGIFSALPVSKSQHFETYFKTPHGLDFEYVAKQFGLFYQKVEFKEDWEPSFNQAINGATHYILEVSTL